MGVSQSIEVNIMTLEHMEEDVSSNEDSPLLVMKPNYAGAASNSNQEINNGFEFIGADEHPYTWNHVYCLVFIGFVLLFTYILVMTVDRCISSPPQEGEYGLIEDWCRAACYGSPLPDWCNRPVVKYY